MKSLAFIVATALAGLTAGLAWAQSPTVVNVFPPMRGIKLTDVHGKLYGAMPGANAAIAQWNIPQKLPPLAFNPATGVYATRNDYASVTYFPDGSVALTQDGRGLPCEYDYPGGRQVDEFDFFLSPPPIRSFIALSDMSKLVFSGTVTAGGDGVFDKVCAVTTGVVLDAIVLTDFKTHQVLFYQIKLGAFGPDGEAGRMTQRPNWFATGKNGQTLQKRTYGYDTQVWSDFGLQTLQPEITTTYQIDVLPKLEAVIAEGAKFGMDQNLANWAVSGGYTGSSVFGHTGLHVHLANLSLCAYLAQWG